MPKTRSFTAPTKDEAIARAVRELGRSIGDDDIAEIVRRPGADGAGVEVHVKVSAEEAEVPDPAAAPPADGASPEALAPKTRDYLTELFRRMGIPAELRIDTDAENVYVEVLVDEGLGGLVIGRQGSTLDAIQYLVNRVVLPGASARGRVYVDSENYRAKHRRKLEELALKYRDEAVRAGQPITLEELSPRDRWIIHQALLQDRQVTTQSVGDSYDRKLMIIPR